MAYEPQQVFTVEDVYRELLRISAEINNLDDPAIVEWTPELWDDSFSGAEGQTYGPWNAGRYIRTGDLIFIQGRLDVAGLGTLTTTNTAHIGNLPYRNITDTVTDFIHGGLAIHYASGLNLSVVGSDPYVAPQLMMYVDGQATGGGKSTNLRQLNTSGGVSALTIAEVSATGDIIFSGWYITDEKA